MDDERDVSCPLLLYGILDADAPTDDRLAEVLRRTGVQEQPLRLMDAGGVSVLASPVVDLGALRAPDVTAALTHKDVVDAAFAVRTVVPLRFGTVVDDPEALPEALAGTPYREQLTRLEGRAEMGVRLTLAPEGADRSAVPDVPYRQDRPGTAYLLARQQKHERRKRRQRQAVRPYRDALARLAEASRSSSARGDDDTVSLAFLIPRNHTGAFHDAASRVTAPGVQSADIVGPWAPYSFV